MSHNFESCNSSDWLMRHAIRRTKRNHKPAIIVDKTVFEPKKVEESAEQVEELDSFLAMFRGMPSEFNRITEIPEHDPDDESSIVQRLAEYQ